MLAAVALEVWAVVLFLGAGSAAPEPSLLPTLALIHTASCLSLSAAVYFLAVRVGILSPRNWLIMCLLMSLAFPAVGPFAMLGVFLVFVASPSERSSAYDEYARYITYDFKPQEKYMDPDKLAEGISQELDVTPLVEVLSESDSAARRGVINVTERLPKKDAIRLLRMVLDDKSVEVRYLAASQLSQIETEFNENVFTARKEVERAPESADAHLALANGYAEYFESGLLDDYAAQYYLGLAIGEYKKVLSLGGENIQIMNYLGNLELAAKRYDEALSKFKRVTQLDPENVYANVGLINVFYEKGQMKDVVRHAKEAMKRMPETKGPMREIVRYWAS
jgi:tetratricopeptide (TPR) repeat protein